MILLIWESEADNNNLVLIKELVERKKKNVEKVFNNLLAIREQEKDRC